MISVPGKLGFTQEKLKVVLPVGATECVVAGDTVLGAVLAALWVLVVRRWVVATSGGVEVAGARRRRRGALPSLAEFSAALSGAAAGCSMVIVMGVDGVVRPLPTMVYPAGTATLILAVKRLMPYPLTWNHRPPSHN